MAIQGANQAQYLLKQHEILTMKKTAFSLSFLPALLVLMLGFGSCKSGVQYPDEVASLELAIDSLTQAQALLAAVDTSEFLSMGREINKNVVFIQTYYQDTMPRETAFMLSDYSSMSKTFKRFRGNRGKLVNKIGFSLAQMQELLTDLKNNVVASPDPKETTDAAEMERAMADEQRAKLYVGTEVSEAENLIQQINAFIVSLERAKNVYDELNPEVMIVVEEVDSKM